MQGTMVILCLQCRCNLLHLCTWSGALTLAAVVLPARYMVKSYICDRLAISRSAAGWNLVGTRNWTWLHDGSGALHHSPRRRKIEKNCICQYTWRKLEAILHTSDVGVWACRVCAGTWRTSLSAIVTIESAPFITKSSLYAMLSGMYARRCVTHPAFSQRMALNSKVNT